MRETRCLYRSEQTLKRIAFGESYDARAKAKPGEKIGARITMRRPAADRCVVWQFRDVLCTVQVGSTYYKRIWADGGVAEIERFRELCALMGVHGNPSSYSWLWRKLVPRYKSRVSLAETDPDTWDYSWSESWPPFGLDAIMEAHGQAGIEAGRRTAPLAFNRWVRGPWRNYDLRCAYGWSVQQGIPDPRSARAVARPGRRARWGVYEVTLPLDGDRRMLPPSLRGDRGTAWVTREDMERYSVSWESVRRGVEYADTWDLRRTVDLLRKCLPDSIAKAVVRTGWGGWHSDAALVQSVYERGKLVSSHELKPMRQPELSSHVVGRVNARMGDVCDGAAQVLTDSVLTRDVLQLGNEWGDWRADGIDYPAIFVDGTGRWFAPDGPVKRAGMQWDEALRRWDEIRRTYGRIEAPAAV